MRVIDGPNVPTGPTDACTIAVADLSERLPRGLDSILTVEGPARAVVRARGAAPRTVVPELLTEAEAGSWAQRIRAAAVREGVTGGASALPDRVELASLPQPVASPQSRSSLRAAVGSTAHGPLEIDLVTGGPHAIVAGTTGSGKSEFLLAWLSAMAGCHPPTRVAFLLVDFKGGAAFEPLRRLPHVTGIVTDLDEAEAERAVLSLRAELRHRESVLRVERARDIIELAPDVEVSRLVIVVDEFQALVERFPDLGAVIADIAARGRSLGVHLVLASQRPNGVVREQVTSNCAIRVSLRVMQTADSNAVVGTDAAASIRSDTPGRGIIDVGDGCPIEFQSAMVDEPWLEEVRRQNVGVPGARRPWVDPLPRRLEPERLLELEARAEPASGAHAIGLVDEPDRQRHGLVAWTPQADGHLLVVGPPGSGRTTALGAVAWSFGREQPGRDSIMALGGPPSAVWDLLHELVAGVRSGTAPAVLLIDDLDVRFREWPEDYRIAAMSLLESLLREGRPRGLAVAASIGQTHRLASGLRESFGSTLLLRHPSRSDLVQAGGSGALWQPDDPAGSGQWRGRRVQLVDAPPPSIERPPDVPVLDLASEARLAVVVSRSPRADAAELAAVPGIESILLEPLGDASVRAALAAAQDGRRRAPVIVGDADAWGASWSLAMQVREEAMIIVHGGLREYRAFDRGSDLPPLLDDPAAQCWVIHAGTPAQRVQWPRRTTETDGSQRDRALNPHPNPQKSYDSDMNA
jgi:DNA segregation ATPase FtsK/SpoIIIE, S-DNA-T family